MNRKLPYSSVGLDKRGPCNLCGVTGPLSKTHVPPRCAGNDGTARTVILQADNEGAVSLAAGRPRTGGARAYLLCETCNNRIGTWDKYVGDFWTSLVQLLNPRNDVVGQTITVEMALGRPGAIVRSLLGGFFAINPDLSRKFPTIARAILSGVPIDPPTEPCLLMEIYLGPRGSVSGGGASLSPISAYVHGEMIWTPIHLLLTPVKYKCQWPGAIDIIGWLADSGEAERSVSMLLPVVGDEALWAQFAQ